MAVPPSASKPQAKEPIPLGLNMLPQKLLQLVVSKVHRKNGLRSTSHILRLAVDACTSEITWSGRPSEVVAAKKAGAPAGGGAPPFVALPAAALVALTLLDCSGKDGEHLEIRRLAGCLNSVLTINCSHTRVTGLGPLAACTLLQTLNCSTTRVSDLGPLAACTLLQTLKCSHTRVSVLDPLAACRLLQNLDCSHTGVWDLGPLAACTLLQRLECSCTRERGLGPVANPRVSYLDPLSACTLLQTLDCSGTWVSYLDPLSAGTLQKTLDCSGTWVTESGPLASCTVLHTLDCSRTRVADLGPLAACTELVSLACPPIHISCDSAQIQRSVDMPWQLLESCRSLQSLRQVGVEVEVKVKGASEDKSAEVSEEE